jgi:hypothetical protein
MTELLTELRKNHWLPLSVGALGIAASFVLLVCSTGSNDIRTWQSFAIAIQASGLLQLYETDGLFNHPPLMGILAWISLEISSALGAPFAAVFKLFPVLANVAAAALLGVMWKERVDLRVGAWAFALFSWALCSILIAAFHGNTDCTCAFLCLLALRYLERGKPASAGVAMALAINVKIIPLLLVCPMWASFRSWRDVRSFFFWGLTGAVPFLVAWAGAGSAFVRNVFGYESNLEPWGVQILIVQLTVLPDMTEQVYHQLVAGYDEFGETAIAVSVLLLSAYGYWRQLDAARLMACAFALFLLLTPGFGVQYLAYLAPLMFAVALGWGFVYAMISGAFIGFVYAHFQIVAYPLESSHTAVIPTQSAFLGFAAWWTILAFVGVCLWDGFAPKPRATSLRTRGAAGLRSRSG